MEFISFPGLVVPDVVKKTPVLQETRGQKTQMHINRKGKDKLHGITKTGLPIILYQFTINIFIVDVNSCATNWMAN
jgi:hypothetical protein